MSSKPWVDVSFPLMIRCVILPPENKRSIQVPPQLAAFNKLDRSVIECVGNTGTVVAWLMPASFHIKTIANHCRSQIAMALK
tara:strand:- start:1687 stop:1932 length:246 start_codon:yes stop_codon:yes gene_type:complete